MSSLSARIPLATVLSSEKIAAHNLDITVTFGAETEAQVHTARFLQSRLMESFSPFDSSPPASGCLHMLQGKLRVALCWRSTVVTEVGPRLSNRRRQNRRSLGSSSSLEITIPSAGHGSD